MSEDDSETYSTLIQFICAAIIFI